MRRVFPLRRAEYCGFSDAEDRKQIASELDDPIERLDEHNHDICATSIKPMKSFEDAVSNTASSDDNYNNIHQTEVKIARPSSHLWPPRASAYPIFTAGSRHHSSPHSSVDKLSSNIERRRSESTSSNQSCESQSKVVNKDSISSKKKTHAERPVSAPKNRPVGDSSSQKTAFRSHSMRMALPPDSMAALSVADEDLIDSRLDCELDGCTLHRRSFFKDTSEGSSSGSSDVSSSFAKTTESFESSTSKRSLGNRSGRGGSSFKYLSARMVAEKLIKVLGKEKMRPSINKATGCELYENKGENSLAWSKGEPIHPEEEFQKPVICSEHAAAHAAHPVGLLGTAHTEDTDNGYFKNDKFLDIEDYSEDQQILEARALAKEELARGLDKENTLLDGKCKSRILEDHTADAMAKNLMFLKREVRKLRKDKKDLALEVAREIRARIFERNSAAEKEKHTNKNIEVMVSAIERDKDNLQEMLERELERRGNEWATKLEKMRTEESQLRERVKEMAEEKAELQKSLSAYKEREASWKIETMEYEHLLSTLQQRLEASEIQLERRAKTSVGDAERIEVADQTPENLSQRVSYLEMENAGMQKEIVRLRRACNDQEMTIEGLCQELDESVNGSYECRNESLLRLQRELLRLAGVEQTQRSEINAIYTELIGLKQKKNITHTGSQTELEKINQELQDRVHTLEIKAADLQEENKKLCLNLRAAIRCRKDAERNLKLLKFKRTNKNMDPEELETDKVCVGKEDERTYPCGNGALQENLKALNSKLQSREAELKRLDEQIIEIVSSKDFLQMEVDDLHGKLLIANQHIRELEREVEKREVAMEVLRTDSDRYKKELTSLQNELFHSRRQRDEMQKEAEDMSKEALRLTLELSESKKAAEKLEEEICSGTMKMEPLRDSVFKSLRRLHCQILVPSSYKHVESEHKWLSLRGYASGDTGNNKQRALNDLAHAVV